MGAEMVTTHGSLKFEYGSDTKTVLEITVEATLKNGLAERLIQEAAARSREPVDLLAEIVETVIKDDLFAAVLDH
jgi:hypothetical protein